MKTNWTVHISFDVEMPLPSCEYVTKHDIARTAKQCDCDISKQEKEKRSRRNAQDTTATTRKHSGIHIHMTNRLNATRIALKAKCSESEYAETKIKQKANGRPVSGEQ